jgi:hypothetical protein
MLSTGTGEQWTDAFLHRVRGEIFLKRDPTNSVPAEVASSQPLPSLESRTRSFELRAALTLAKLYQLTSYQSASRSQLCARRVFAEAGISGDRRGASASRRARLVIRPSLRLLSLPVGQRLPETPLFAKASRNSGLVVVFEL